MDTRDTLIKLGISVGLGLLVGLQRERKKEELAGIRTFALLTLFGAIAGLLASQIPAAAGWVVAAGLLAVGALMAVGAVIKARTNRLEIGLTTEVAALVMYGLGAYIGQSTDIINQGIVAVVLGGAVVLLLYWKDLLHGFVNRMGDKDVSAIMQFVLISLVIWPLLPNARYGPYGFFNPFQTWLVVILVVSMSLAGYVLYKLVPPAAGAILGGAIGGLISSTATTVSYSRRARAQPAGALLSAQAIMLATLVSVLRVMVLVAIFVPAMAKAFLLPLAALAVFMAILSSVTLWAGRHASAGLPEHQNPTELKSALIFAAIYTAVKFTTAWGRDTYGTSALYTIGGIAGLTDVDAITLSMSESARNASVAAAIAWRVIVVAIMSNLIFKAGVVYVLGNRQLAKWITLLFGISLAAGIILIFAWPG